MKGATKVKRTIAIILLVAVLLLTACTPSNGALFEKATACIGKTADDLKEEIGQPNYVMYASSCLGDGQDGELFYNGFTVYTYLDTDGTETVYDVIETDPGTTASTDN